MNETIVIVAVMCNVDKALPTPTILSPSAADLKIYICQKNLCNNTLFKYMYKNFLLDYNVHR